MRGADKRAIRIPHPFYFWYEKGLKYRLGLPYLLTLTTTVFDSLMTNVPTVPAFQILMNLFLLFWCLIHMHVGRIWKSNSSGTLLYLNRKWRLRLHVSVRFWLACAYRLWKIRDSAEQSSFNYSITSSTVTQPLLIGWENSGGSSFCVRFEFHSHCLFVLWWWWYGRKRWEWYQWCISRFRSPIRSVSVRSKTILFCTIFKNFLCL